MRYFLLFLLPVMAIIHAPEKGSCAPVEKTPPEETEWGLVMAVRTAQIGFAFEESTVSSFLPMLYFSGDHFYLKGTEGGIKLWESDNFRCNLLGRLRFYDIPSDYQNDIQEDTVDFGPQIQYFISDELTLSLDYLIDDERREQANLNMEYATQTTQFELWPYLNLRYTGSEFNSYYYGFDKVDVDGTYEFSMGIRGRYHLWNNLYAVGKLQTTWRTTEITNVPYVEDKHVSEMYFGIGVFNNHQTPPKPELSIKPYLRVAHGWATPSDLNTIMTGHTEPDRYNNQLTSVFYGHPLADELFGIPLQIYLTPGFVHHWHSDTQSSIQEYIIAIKGYYTLNWPLKWRIGFAEGVSYLSEATYIEKAEMEQKGYEPTKAMNYLDISFDIELGQFFKGGLMDDWYIGYSLHHRSAMYEAASQFGRLKGGSNYNTIYLQYHF